MESAPWSLESVVYISILQLSIHSSINEVREESLGWKVCNRPEV
jgi:hypothetical protein